MKPSKALYQFSKLPGTTLLIFVAGATYACNDLLVNTPQGALDEHTLANAAGVEGSLTATYKILDHNTGVGGAWGTAASNWMWGSVTRDDAYRGSEASAPIPITSIELYNWGGLGGRGLFERQVARLV
jgi:hypothetical protein